MRSKHFLCIDSTMLRVSTSLIKCVQDSGDFVAITALQTIGRCGQGSRKAVEVIEPLLKTGSLQRRTQAACCLYTLTGKTESVAPVLAEYSSSRPDVNDAVFSGCGKNSRISRQAGSEGSRSHGRFVQTEFFGQVSPAVPNSSKMCSRPQTRFSRMSFESD